MSDDTIEYAPDDTAPTEQGLKVSVTFDRKVSDGNYGGMEARAWVEGEVARDADAATLAAKLQELFFTAKVVVLDELAVPYVSDDNGVIREKASTAPLNPVVSNETRVEHAMGPQTHSIKIMNAGKGASDEPLPDEVIEWATSKGFTAIYDNRLSRTGNQPHFKQALTKAQVDAKVKAEGYWIK